jgi:hypothetical protein
VGPIGPRPPIGIGPIWPGAPDPIGPDPGVIPGGIPATPGVWLETTANGKIFASFKASL